MFVALVLWIVGINAITEQQFQYLKDWKICFESTPFNGQCDVQCYALGCVNEEPYRITFEDTEWSDLNQTHRDQFQYFPKLEILSVAGGFRQVQLYPEISHFLALKEIDIRATITGTFPTELATLRNLTSFRTNSHQLVGTLPLELENLNITFFSLGGTTGQLYGPIPNFTNASVCILTSGTIGDPVSNPGLFCECYGSCRERIYDGRRRNRCSETCSTQRSGRCAKEVATLGHGYVCVDACDRCPTECMPNIDNSAYICPGDPTLPPSPPPLSTSDWIIFDLDDDDDYKSDYARSLKLF